MGPREFGLLGLGGEREGDLFFSVKTNYLQKLAGGEAARAIVVCAAGSGGARACGVFREQVHLATRW